MKIKFVVVPKQELKAELKTVPFLLDESQMSSLYGGATCGEYTNCHADGKNSCFPYDCGLRTSCTQTKYWEA